MCVLDEPRGTGQDTVTSGDEGLGLHLGASHWRTRPDLWEAHAEGTKPGQFPPVLPVRTGGHQGTLRVGACRSPGQQPPAGCTHPGLGARPGGEEEPAPGTAHPAGAQPVLPGLKYEIFYWKLKMHTEN